MQQPVGIRGPYGRIPLSLKARALAAAARPFTILGPIFGVAAAYCMSIAYAHVPRNLILHDWHTVLYGTVTLVLVTIGSNYVNQATDLEEDKISKNYRPGPRGLLTKDELHTWGVTFWLFAVLRAATVSTPFGVIITLIVLTSFIYSHPPIRLKARIWLGNAGVALARGLLGLPAAWTLFASWRNPQPWGAGIVLFLFLLGSTTAKDFADEEGDRAAGIRNLVTIYGSRRAQFFSVPFILSPIITFPLMAHATHYHWDVGSQLALGIVLIWFAYVFLTQPTVENRVLEGNRPWVASYVSLFAIFAVYAIPGL